MNVRGLILAAIAGVGFSAQAADVQLFGIHIPELGKWATYARISNDNSANPSAGITKVTGIASISVNVLNNGGNVVTGATNTLPQGTTSKTDVLSADDPTAQPVGYGFWTFRGAQLNGTGAHNIEAAQYTGYDTNPPAYFNKFVLQGTGLTAGSQAVDPANFITSSTSWLFPLQVATGTYTPVATTGAASQIGLTISFPTDRGVGLLRDADPSAAVNWSGPGNTESATSTLVIDSRYTTGALGGTVVGTVVGTTVKAGVGDADLNGTVDLNDLIKLANHYGSAGTWFDGDFTLDGVVDLNDLVTLANHYGSTVADVGGSEQFAADLQSAFSGSAQPVAVPEPVTIGGLALAAAGSMLRRGRRTMVKSDAILAPYSSSI